MAGTQRGAALPRSCCLVPAACGCLAEGPPATAFSSEQRTSAAVLVPLGRQHSGAGGGHEHRGGPHRPQSRRAPPQPRHAAEPTRAAQRSRTAHAPPQVEEACKPQCVKALLAYQARAQESGCTRHRFWSALSALVAPGPPRCAPPTAVSWLQCWRCWALRLDSAVSAPQSHLLRARRARSASRAWARRRTARGSTSTTTAASTSVYVPVSVATPRDQPPPKAARSTAGLTRRLQAAPKLFALLK